MRFRPRLDGQAVTVHEAEQPERGGATASYPCSGFRNLSVTHASCEPFPLGTLLRRLPSPCDASQCHCCAGSPFGARRWRRCDVIPRGQRAPIFALHRFSGILKCLETLTERRRRIMRPCKPNRSRDSGSASDSPGRASSFPAATPRPSCGRCCGVPVRTSLFCFTPPSAQPDPGFDQDEAHLRRARDRRVRPSRSCSG